MPRTNRREFCLWPDGNELQLPASSFLRVALRRCWTSTHAVEVALDDQLRIEWDRLLY